MYPGLSISRSIGDLIAHKVGVTSQPNVSIVDLKQEDKFLVVGSDGIWDYVSPEDMVDLLNEYSFRDSGMATELICQKVKDACAIDKLDDMTVIISIIN